MWGCAILGTYFKFKKNLEEKLVVTNSDMWALLDFCTSPFSLMILMQNFILINNHLKPHLHHLLDQVHRCSEGILVIEAFTCRSFFIFLPVSLTFGTSIHWIKPVSRYSYYSIETSSQKMKKPTW